jgi:hypothetical protein
MLDLICTILHNIAMFEDNVEQIRSVGCIEAMKPYLDSEDKTIRLLCLATLADLVNESESEIGGGHPVIWKGRGHGPFDTHSFVILCRCHIQKLKGP